MSSATLEALEQPDVLANVLEHVYSLERSDLLATSLVAKAWTVPSQALLHSSLHLTRGTRQLEQWLAGAGPDKRAKYPSSRVVVETRVDPDHLDLAHALLGRVFDKLRGVRVLAIALVPQQLLPAQLILQDDLAHGLRQLVLGNPLSVTAHSQATTFDSLDFVGILERNRDLEPDWSDTFDILVRSVVCTNHRPSRIELTNVSGYPRYLVPALPLAKDPRSIRGNLLPFAPHLRTVTFPYLVPAADLHNLAIFGVACRALETLGFTEITTASASAIPVLRFFPTIKRLVVDRIVGLPHAPTLLPHQVARLATVTQRGDPFKAIADLVASDTDVPELHDVAFVAGKHTEHVTLVMMALAAKGGAIQLPDQLELDPAERQLAESFREAEQTIKELEEAKASWANGATQGGSDAQE
ncbi:hypothetical protein JCM11491_001171 [Sporobolomyces phaffii]